MRSLWLVFVSPLIGAVLTVAVGWGCLLWWPAENARPGAQFTRHSHRVIEAISQYGTFDGFTLFEYHGVGWEMESVIASSKHLRNTHRRHNELIRVSAGWPWLCLEGEWRTINSQPASWGILTLPRLPWSSPVNHRYVPVSPRWAPLVGNATLYAALVLCAVFSVRTIRRIARIRRGACICCGYNLRSLLQCQTQVRCPECGKLATR